MRKISKKSAYDVGATIYLDGEKEYKQACAEINKAMKDLNGEMKLTKSEFIGNEDSLKSLKKQYEIQKDIVSQNEERIRTLNGALEDAKAKYGENSRQVEKWEEQLRNAKIQLNKSRAELEKLEDQKKSVKKLSESFEDFKEQAAKVKDAIGKVTSAGKSLAKLELKAVTTSVKGLGVAAGAVATGAVAGGAAMVNFAKDAAAAGDEIDKASKRMGVSAEKFQELRYAAGLCGIEMSTLETAAKTLEKNGGGLDLTQAIKQLSAIKDETKRSEKAIELFGSKAAYSMGPLLAQGSEKIEEMMQAAQACGIVMSDEAVAASATFTDSLSTMQSTLSNIKNSMSAEFMPGLTEIMDGITALFTGQDSAVDMISGGVQDIAKAIDELVPQIEAILSAIVSVISELAPTIIDVLVSGLSESLPKIVEAAVTILSTLVAALVENADKIISAADTLITELCNSLLEETTLKNIINAAINLVVTLVSSIVDSIDLIIDAAVTIIDTLVDTLTNDDNMPKLIDGAVDITVGIIGGLLSAIPQLISAAGELIAALVDALINYDWSSIGAKIWAKIKSAWSGKEAEVIDEVKVNGSHANGLYSVPFDGYIAELHESERVLTASQAQAYNRGEYLSNEAVMRKLEASQNQSSTEMYLLRQQMAEIAAILKGGIPVNVDNTREIKRAVSGVA